MIDQQHLLLFSFVLILPLFTLTFLFSILLGNTLNKSITKSKKTLLIFLPVLAEVS